MNLILSPGQGRKSRHEENQHEEKNQEWGEPPTYDAECAGGGCHLASILWLFST